MKRIDNTERYVASLSISRLDDYQTDFGTGPIDTGSVSLFNGTLTALDLTELGVKVETVMDSTSDFITEREDRDRVVHRGSVSPATERDEYGKNMHGIGYRAGRTDQVQEFIGFLGGLYQGLNDPSLKTVVGSIIGHIDPDIWSRIQNEVSPMSRDMTMDEGLRRLRDDLAQNGLTGKIEIVEDDKAPEGDHYIVDSSRPFEFPAKTDPTELTPGQVNVEHFGNGDGSDCKCPGDTCNCVPSFDTLMKEASTRPVRDIPQA